MEVKTRHPSLQEVNGFAAHGAHAHLPMRSLVGYTTAKVNGRTRQVPVLDAARQVVALSYDTYLPERDNPAAPIRPGADDHQKCPSLIAGRRTYRNGGAA
jgi:hypothetical protein